MLFNLPKKKTQKPSTLREIILSFIRRAFFMTIGAFIVAVALEMFLLPNKIIDGGVIGISMMMSYLTGGNLGLFILGINLPFVLFAYKTLGKKFGKQMKEIAAVIAQFSQEDIANIEKVGKYTLNLNDGAIEIELSDVEIATEDMPGWLVANDGLLTIALDVELTPALIEEGIARELVNRIQNLRKASGLEITDRIAVQIERQDAINDAVLHFSDYIASQVLANSIELSNNLQDATLIEDMNLHIHISKVGC